MKVLFVSSGNYYLGITSVIRRQAESLEACGIEIVHFYIRGKGLKGYLSNLKHLKKAIRSENPDIIHAHYSLSGYLASMAGARPLVVSLMGSDVKNNKAANFPLKIYASLFRAKIIVKSERMFKNLGLPSASVISNGVDLKLFRPVDKMECKRKLGWDLNFRHILFAANPSRTEKNYALAEKAFQQIQSDKLVLKTLTDVNPEDVPLWMNAADVILLTSLKEGSPNAVKEAMACNKPVVSTDVGDIRWLFGNVAGYFISASEVNSIAENILKALSFSEEKQFTEGRERILSLGLDTEVVSGKIIELYENLHVTGK